MLKKSDKAALAQAFDYFDSVVNSDIKRVDDVDRDEELAKRIMRSYARNQASQATAGTILADIKNNGDVMKKPSFLMVLTGVGDYAYKRPEDGVLVVPIGCLKE